IAPSSPPIREQPERSTIERTIVDSPMEREPEHVYSQAAAAPEPPRSAPPAQPPVNQAPPQAPAREYPPSPGRTAGSPRETRDPLIEELDVPAILRRDRRHVQ